MDRFDAASERFVAIGEARALWNERAAAGLRKAALRGADLIYFDAVSRDASGQTRIDYLPDWSFDTLRSYAYIRSPLIASEGLWQAVTGRGRSEAKTLYDLTLRLTQQASFVDHVPVPLETETYTSSAKLDMAALRASLKRSGARAHVVEGLFTGSAAVFYVVPPNTRISVVVYASGEPVEQVRATLESVAIQSTYPNKECIVADGGETEARKERYFAYLTQNKGARIVRMQEKSLSRLCNMAAERALGDCLLFLPAGARVRRGDSLEHMAGMALQDGVGAVGAKRLGRTGALDGGFPLWGVNGAVHGLFDGALDRTGDPTQDRLLNCIRNVWALEPPLMVRRDRLWEAGGFDETFPQIGFAAALCDSLLYKRKRNVYMPYAAFDTDEVVRRKPDESEQLRLDDLLRRCRVYGDPYLSRAETIVQKLSDMRDASGSG